jgi:hypothetical protein
VASGVQSPRLDGLAIALLVARVLQTVTHVAVRQTDAVVGMRFAFFLTQLVCMAAMGMLVALTGWSRRVSPLAHIFLVSVTAD